MKKIIFPCTSRVHLARQKLLIEELRKEFEVDIWEPKTKPTNAPVYSIFCAIEFNNYLANKKYDGALIRADRMELLLLAGICAYKGIPVIHLEGGNTSGARVIDSKVRHAISQLADIHFVTDVESERKVITLGADPKSVFNVGSLDVSFAKQVDIEPKEEDYILFLHHAIPGEDSELVYDAIKELGYEIKGVKSNDDYKKSLMNEEYSPEEFISLLANAKCLVGNSSASCKEASILGTPVVLTGTRQDGRLTGHNVLRTPHKKERIKILTNYQIEHGEYEPDEIYYQPNTEKRIVEILKQNL